MQMCPDCERIYDESEYAACPYCHPKDEGTIQIVYDSELEKVLELTDEEYEEFKKTHPEYH